MSNLSDLIGGSGGGAVTGEFAEYPAISTPPEGYIKADGTIYQNTCYPGLGTCFNNKLYTSAASIPFAGTTYNMAAWQPFVEAQISWGTSICCWNRSNQIMCNTCTGDTASQYIATRYTSCGYNLCSIYNGLCQCGESQSCWLRFLDMSGDASWEQGFNRLMTPCGVAVTPFAENTACCVPCRGKGYIIWYQDPTWTNPVECILKNGTSYMRHKCDVWFSCGSINCQYKCGYGFSGTTICNHIVFVSGGRTNQVNVLTMLGESQNQPCVCKQRMWLETKTDGSCNMDYICGNEYCCAASGIPHNLALKVNYLCGTTATACDSKCPFIGVITRTLGSNVCCNSGTTCCDKTSGVFAFGGGNDAWYTAPNCCCAYFGCTRLCDRVWPISRWIMTPPICYGTCKISGLQVGVRMTEAHDYHWQLFSNSGQPCISNSMPVYCCRGFNLLGDHWESNYDVGYDRFVSFGCLCFGVGVVDGSCNLTITCYPLSCIPGGSRVVKVCYSNPLNKFIATTENNTVLISNGDSGHVWSCVCTFSSGHHILSVRNLDNKVAIFAGSGAVLLSCDSSNWTYIFNRDKMIVGDRSAKLIKWNNYYIGAGSIYSCDLCCSGYSSAPGKIACSATLGAIISVNTPTLCPRVYCPTNIERKRDDYIHSAEVAAYCANFTDSIYWKFCSLHSFCIEGSRCNYFPIGGGVSETCDSVWALYRVTCSQSCCARLRVKRLPLSSCEECHYDVATMSHCNSLFSGCCNCWLFNDVTYQQVQAPGEIFYYGVTGMGCICSRSNWKVGLVAHRGTYCNVTVIDRNRYNCAPWSSDSRCYVYSDDGVKYASLLWCCNGVCCSTFQCLGYHVALRYPNPTLTCFYAAAASDCCCLENSFNVPRVHSCGCVFTGCCCDQLRCCGQNTVMTKTTGEVINLAGDGSNFTSLASAAESQYYLANVACPSCGYCQTLIQGTGTIPVNPLLYHQCTSIQEFPNSSCNNFHFNTRASITNAGVVEHNGSIYTTFGGPAPCFDTATCFQVPCCPGKFIKT